MTRIRALIVALAVAAALPGGASAAEEYVPFVTDFPKPAERYVPFVSDFPQPVAPAPDPAGGTTWDDVPAPALGAVVAALLAGAALFLHHRRHPVRLDGC
jgi:hypothetical protein